MRTIVYFSSIPWSYFHHRQQEMMSWFAAKGWRVLFWEPNERAAGAALEQVGERIWLVRTPGLLLERASSAVHALNARKVWRAFGRLEEHFGLDAGNTVVWFDRVHGTPYRRLAGRYACAADLIDEISAFGRIKRGRFLHGIERDMLARCGLVLSSSRTLAKRKGLAGDNRLLFVPNGVDFAAYPSATADGMRRADNVAAFAGTLSARSIDVSMLRAVAMLLPDVRFELFGPVAADWPRDAFAGLRNVQVRGAVAPEDIPGLLARCSVGMIPYRLTEGSMDYVFPKKLAEYLAAGLPVVSTPLPECVAAAGGPVVCAGDAAAFAAAIEAALASDADGAVREARAAARTYDWNRLLGLAEGRVSELLRRDVER